MSLADDETVSQLIALAKREDLGAGDLTSGLLPRAGAVADFRFLARQRGVFAGGEIAPRVLHAYDPSILIEWSAAGTDGARIESPPTELAMIHGPLGAVLSAERVMLNFVQRLCGVATLTQAFVDAVSGTGAKILDTRKTTPGWRTLEKYAVRCGGGRNHRAGLFDAVLIKDNHLAGVPTDRLAGAIFEMLNALSASDARPAFIEVEATDVAQVEELLKVVGIDTILLDNFSIEALREAVKLRDDVGLRGKVSLEASGGVTLRTVRAIAETGVERISVGALTHSATAIDLSLERI
jgi:nicotinate-nucleotide pyrophosphorylase (carboxylating)